jgi:hypothetical protein
LSAKVQQIPKYVKEGRISLRVLQYTHLPDGDFVQLYQPFAPGKSFVDEHGVDVFLTGIVA